MALSSDELDLIDALWRELRRTSRSDQLLLKYYKGQQRVEQLGMAIPPNMRKFLVIANWPRVVVDTIVERQQVQALLLPGEEKDNETLRAIWDANNLSAQLIMFNRDRRVFGRAFWSVGTNEADAEPPMIRVEPPMAMSALVDGYSQSMLGAARFYRDRRRYIGAPERVTLYAPGATVSATRERGAWVEMERDEHGGPVPIIMHLHRSLSGEWCGESAMSDIIGLTDSAARSLTNLQFAQEAHGIPRMFMTGVTQGEFIDPKTKEAIPQFEAYYSAIHTITNAQGKVGQLTAADLKNFETALQIYGKQASIVTGFPASYFGLTTTNPSSADAIRADEAKLVRTTEMENVEVGTTLGWAGALAYEYATGESVPGNQIGVTWVDPATPTVAQQTDAVVKLRSQGAISREGMWDMLGWSEARKTQERANLAAEAQTDPAMLAALSLAGTKSSGATA